MTKEQLKPQGIEPLPTEVRKHRRTMKQVWRDEHTAIYEYFGGYEVIVVKKRPPETILGRSYPAREGYPSDEEWGTLAITRPESDSLEYLKRRAKDLYENHVSSSEVPPRVRGKGAGVSR
jgi:hypothetical protein